MAKQHVVACLTLAALGVSVGADVCQTGVTLSGFTKNEDLNGDFLNKMVFGSPSDVGSSYFTKEGMEGKPHQIWLTYDSEITGHPIRWSIYTEGERSGAPGRLLAYCKPGEDAGCPEGEPPAEFSGKVWPKNVGAITWNVLVDGMWCSGPSEKCTYAPNPGVVTTCCPWKRDECDNCNCKAGLLKNMCMAGCGANCCEWSNCGEFEIICSCNQKGRQRHCDHTAGARNLTMTSAISV